MNIPENSQSFVSDAPNFSTASASSSPLNSLESVFPLDALNLPNFSALTHSSPPSLQSLPLTTLTDNMKQSLDNLCQSYHQGITLFEEMLRTVRVKEMMSTLPDHFTDSEDGHQIEYFESLIGAVEQNINICHTQYCK